MEQAVQLTNDILFLINGLMVMATMVLAITAGYVVHRLFKGDSNDSK